MATMRSVLAKTSGGLGGPMRFLSGSLSPPARKFGFALATT